MTRIFISGEELPQLIKALQSTQVYRNCNIIIAQDFRKYRSVIRVNGKSIN